MPEACSEDTSGKCRMRFGSPKTATFRKQRGQTHYATYPAAPFPVMLFALFLAESQAPQQPPQDPMGTMIWFGAIMVIMWVLMIRPQQKRQKELNARIAALKIGDKIVTMGGIHGTVTNVKEGSTIVMR